MLQLLGTPTLGFCRGIRLSGRASGSVWGCPLLRCAVVCTVVHYSPTPPSALFQERARVAWPFPTASRVRLSCFYSMPTSGSAGDCHLCSGLLFTVRQPHCAAFVISLNASESFPPHHPTTTTAYLSNKGPVTSLEPNVAYLVSWSPLNLDLQSAWPDPM